MSGKIEQRLADLLRAGAATAGVVVLAGSAWFLAVHGTDAADYHTFRGEPAGLRGVAGLLRAPLMGEGRAIMQLGIVILVATPIARVAFSVGAFAWARDRAYVAITATVLLVLVYSLFGGR
jgi:uncharacterized membrane protein